MTSEAAWTIHCAVLTGSASRDWTSPVVSVMSGILALSVTGHGPEAFHGSPNVASRKKPDPQVSRNVSSRAPAPLNASLLAAAGLDPPSHAVMMASNLPHGSM